MQFHHSQTMQQYLFCCCHTFQEKAKAIKLPFCTREFGKEKQGNLFWQGLDWLVKGIFVKGVKDTQQQLNPAVVVMPDDCVGVYKFVASFLALRVQCRVLLFVVLILTRLPSSLSPFSFV